MTKQVMKQINLGNKVHISDPCYSTDVWCRMTVDNVEPGVYNAFVDISDEGNWGNRVARLVIFHESLTVEELALDECLNTIGVDSGQAGFFSDESYRNDTIADRIVVPTGEWSGLGIMDEPGDKWYDKMCALTINEPERWGAYAEGVVSRSGYGDGMYPVYAQVNSLGKIVAMEIEFIGPEDEEEDDAEAI